MHLVDFLVGGTGEPGPLPDFLYRLSPNGKVKEDAQFAERSCRRSTGPLLDRVGTQSNRRSVQLNFIVVPACLSVLGFELSPAKTEGSGTRQCSRL